MNTTATYDTASDLINDQLVVTDKAPSLLERAGQAIKEFASISEVMRLVGAMGVLSSMFVFLMQNWNTDTDFELFLFMLTQTALLATAGFVMFKALKENKSARLFFGLSLVSTAVNFTVLGALFYSSFHLDSPRADYADYAHWAITDVGTLVMAAIGSIILLLPLSYFSFSVLSRPAAKQLTAWYFGLNLLLLLPLRDPSIILAVSLAVLIALSRLLFKKGASNDNDESTAALSCWKTLEGKFARIILFAPLFVFTLRSMFWYEINDIAVLMMLATAYVVARQLSFVTKDKLNHVVNGLSLVLGFFGAIWIAIDFVHLPAGLSQSLDALVFTLLFVLACVDIYKRTELKGMKAFVYHIGAIIVAAVLTLNHLFSDTVLTFSIALIASFILFSTAYQLRSTFNIVLSTIMMLGLSVLYGQEIIGALFNSGWLGLAVSGITIIVLASLLDRYGAVLKLKYNQKKEAFVS